MALLDDLAKKGLAAPHDPRRKNQPSYFSRHPGVFRASSRHFSPAPGGGRPFGQSHRWRARDFVAIAWFATSWRPWRAQAAANPALR
jgi:hypothetical protein